jgi:hypothetical protein
MLFNKSVAGTASLLFASSATHHNTSPARSPITGDAAADALSLSGLLR